MAVDARRRAEAALGRSLGGAHAWSRGGAPAVLGWKRRGRCSAGQRWSSGRDRSGARPELGGEGGVELDRSSVGRDGWSSGRRAGAVGAELHRSSGWSAGGARADQGRTTSAAAVRQTETEPQEARPGPASGGFAWRRGRRPATPGGGLARLSFFFFFFQICIYDWD